MAGLVLHVFIYLGHAYILYAVSSARIPNWWGVRRQDVSITTMTWILTCQIDLDFGSRGICYCLCQGVSSWLHFTVSNTYILGLLLRSPSILASCPSPVGRHTSSRIWVSVDALCQQHWHVCLLLLSRAAMQTSCSGSHIGRTSGVHLLDCWFFLVGRDHHFICLHDCIRTFVFRNAQCARYVRTLASDG